MPKLLLSAPKQKEPPPSFLALAQHRLISEFTRIKTKYELNSIVLVLDMLSAQVMSYLFSVTQLVAHGINYIERL